MSLLLTFHPKVASASASGRLSAAGSNTSAFVGAAKNAGAVSVVNAGGFAVGGKSIAKAALSVSGSSSISFAGSSGGTVASAALFASSSVPITGLIFPKNGDLPADFFAFNWTGANLPDIEPLTIISKYFPYEHADYYTKFFHARGDGSFLGDFTYFGTHPYPNGGVGGLPHYWEISVIGGDFVTDANGNDTTVEYDRWHTQASMTVDLGASNSRVDFYWDIETSTTRLITKTLGGKITNASASPELIWGGARWAQLTERGAGIHRGIQIYTETLALADAEQLAVLETDAQVLAKVAELGITSLFYLNMNPIASDISDKSGNGHDPAWVDPGAVATDWSSTAAAAAVIAFQGKTVTRGALSVSGSGQATFGGKSAAKSALAVTGQGNLTAVGAATGRGAISIQGQGAANFEGATPAAASGALSAAGQSGVSLAASSTAAAALNVQGASVTAFGGASLAGSALQSDSGTSAEFSGAQAAEGAADLAIAGTGSMLATGSAIAAAAFASSSGTEAVFGGASIQPAAMFSESGASVSFSSENAPVTEVEETPSETAGGGAGRSVYDMVKARRKRRQQAQEQRDFEDVVALIELIESHGMKRAA